MKLREIVRALGLALLLALLSAQAGEAQSVHPLYREGEVETEPALVGTWEAWGLRFTFEPVKDSGYELTMADQDKELPFCVVFDVRLVRLRGELYLDAKFSRTTIAGKRADELVPRIPIHLLIKASFENGQMVLVLPSDTWFEEATLRGRIRIRHEKYDDLILLMAPTDELRDFICDYSRELFDENGDKLRLTRVQQDS